MDISRSRNKNTYYLIILARLCRFTKRAATAGFFVEQIAQRPSVVTADLEYKELLFLFVARQSASSNNYLLEK